MPYVAIIALGQHLSIFILCCYYCYDIICSTETENKNTRLLTSLVPNYIILTFLKLWLEIVMLEMPNTVVW